MQVIVNGEPCRAADGSTVAELLAELGLHGRLAVELNDEVLPRSEHERRLAEGDRIEIVRAIGGGLARASQPCGPRGCAL